MASASGSDSPVVIINEPADYGADLKPTGTSSHRKDKSRMNAQSRRTTHAQLLKELGSLLPFPQKVVQQIDYNSILRLVLCYFRMKNLSIQDGSSSPKAINPAPKKPSVSLGKMQDLMIEALDGFVLVLLFDGTIIYLSENVHKYLGLFQSEHIGTNIFDLILNEDHNDVKDALKHSEIDSMSLLEDGAPCAFFCRMKCPKFKMAMCAAKSPGYKLMYISGHFKVDGAEPRLVAVVRPVCPPSILEIRMEGNMFVTHYTLDMRCTFFDGRLKNLLGYTKEDLLDRNGMELHHHDDVAGCQKVHASLLQKGEGISGYYRMLTKFGKYVWCQTRAHMMFDSRSGQPSYIVCMNFIINKTDGDFSLAQRAIEAGKGVDSKQNLAIVPVAERSYDPFPVISNEWSGRNPYTEIKITEMPSPEEEDVDGSVKSRTPSPSTESSKSPQSDAGNTSPQSSDQLSVDSHYNTTTSPINRHSVSSIESGYESNMSTPPNSVQMRNTNAPTAVCNQDAFSDSPAHTHGSTPAHTNGSTYYQHKPQINFVQNHIESQPFQNLFQPPKQYQTVSASLSMTVLSGRNVKPDPYVRSQCAGSKRSHQPVQQPSTNNVPEGSPDPILGADMLMSSFNDSIPPIAPLKELKTEDLDILELPAPSCNTAQMQHSTQWPQNKQYIPNDSQPLSHMTPGNGQGNLILNPLKQQLRNGVQSQALYHI